MVIKLDIGLSLIDLNTIFVHKISFLHIVNNNIKARNEFRIWYINHIGFNFKKH
jgi:hypothetical protein